MRVKVCGTGLFAIVTRVGRLLCPALAFGFALMVVAPLIQAALIPRVVVPAATDPAITNFAPLFRHWVYLDSAAPRAGKLFVFLPGTGAPPNVYRLILETAAHDGCHSIGLTYMNEQEVNDDLCASQPENCPEDARIEIITGADTSPRIAVDRANSIENRLVKLLEYLARVAPDEGWGDFLRDGAPVWERMAVAGHSQGGGHAAMMGKLHLVHRALLFSATEPAPWTTEAPFTPADRYFGFAHSQESAILPMRLSWANLGLPGPLTSVNSAAAPTNNSHRLITGLMPRGDVGESNYHGCVVVDFYTPLQADGLTPVFRQTWRYMIGSGAAPPTPPRLSVAVQETLVLLEWNSATNELFTVEHRSRLDRLTDWTTLFADLPAASGSRTMFIHSNAFTSPNGFYRVIRTR
jgi:hypothetical protein